MMKLKSVTQHSFTLLLALLMSACLSDSATDGPANATISLAITSPTSASTIHTTDAAVGLAGNADSESGIFKVTWTNDRGGAGIADGTETWRIASIALDLGANRITVTAEDTAGATASRSIFVNRESGQIGSATLSWVAPTTRTDGSPLTNLSGYKVFYGRMSGIYDYQIDIDNPAILVYVVENLVSGDWYFALTAYDSEGLESDRSNEVLRQIS